MVDYLMVRKTDRCLVNDVKVGFQYGSVISPLLFAVVSSELRSGLPSGLLYASDLVFMAPTMEQPARRVADWRVSLLNKGLNVNSERSKVMVGSSDGKIIVNDGKRPCGGVVCLTRSMKGRGEGHSNFQLIGELTFSQHAAGVVGALNYCAFLYHSGILSTIIFIIGH